MKTESKRFLFEKELVWENVGGGVNRQIMAYNEDLMMVKVRFDTGGVGSAHAHPHTQTTYVVSGIFEFTTEQETQIIKPGDGVYIRPNVTHSCKCLEAGILLDTFSPMREDFL